MSDSPLWTDPVRLADQYGTDANLVARQAIYAYQRPPIDLIAEVLALAGLRGTETVLDAGCGNGRYLAALSGHRGPVLGFDLSAGMLRTARAAAPGAGVARADVARPPLPDASVDVVIAAHVLYHVPDPEAAVREFRRILRPGGRVLAVLNGADHLTVLHPAHQRLTLDAGERLLATHFPAVTRHDFRGELQLPDRAPIDAYAASLLTTTPITLTGPPPYRIPTHTGCLVARAGEGKG